MPQFAEEAHTKLGYENGIYWHLIIWVNYNDLTATSLELWLISEINMEIIPKWP